MQYQLVSESLTCFQQFEHAFLLMTGEKIFGANPGYLAMII